jgi:predicted nucleic acid-binding protein
VNESSDRTVVWDATAPRHLALADALDILIAVTGLRTPRIVADPSEPSGDDLLICNPDTLSEISSAEWHFLYEFRRHGDLADFQRAGRLAAVRKRPELIVEDLTEDEQDDFEVYASQAFTRRHDLLVPLGRGERAVIAVAGNRQWTAGLDDGAARAVAEALGVAVITTQQLLITAVTQGHLSKAEANDLYRRLLDGGFWGPPDLYAEPT